MDMQENAGLFQLIFHSQIVYQRITPAYFAAMSEPEECTYTVKKENHSV
jgi:hypothetical protein